MKNLSVKIAHLNCIIIHNTYTPWEREKKIMLHILQSEMPVQVHIYKVDKGSTI